MQTNMRSLLGAIARAVNLIDRDVQFHQEQTAYLSYMIAKQLDFDEDEVFFTVNSAFVHDIGSVIGSVSKEERETKEGKRRAAQFGASMMREIDGFQTTAEIVENVPNSYSACACKNLSERILKISQTVHLAEYVSSAIKKDIPVLSQAARIKDSVIALRGTEFAPEIVDAFITVSRRECMWMDAAYDPGMLMSFVGHLREVPLEKLVIFTRFMSRMTDFRSSFTAMHSAGVAASARELAKYAGLPDDEIQKIEIAGNLHDIGKLRVPNDILEKPGKLTDEEFNIVKEHAYYTKMVLKDVEGFEQISDLAAYHHEKLNGNGYPYHLMAEQLDTGARIIAVADIFSAITEIRPYRSSMDREQVIKILDDSVQKGEISKEIVCLLKDHYDEINTVREEESRRAGKRYYESLALVEKEWSEG